MNILFVFLELFSLKKKSLENINSVGVLFLPSLGIGDLVMLSPAIENIRNIYPSAKIFLITWVTPIINFEGVEFVNYKKIDNQKFDLIISPTLNLRHLVYIFQARYWVGYFSKSISQSNFLKEKCSYDLRNEHYLLRAIRLVTLLDQKIGSGMMSNFETKSVHYPSINQEKPEIFDEKLSSFEYFVLGALSKWPDRQWPIEKMVEVVSWILDNKFVEKVVIIGDKSRENQDLAKTYEKMLQKYSDCIVNITGLTSLSQTAYILAHSKFYLGLDSGPTHLAYLLAPKTLSIFITVDPALRIPLQNDKSHQVFTVYPSPAPIKSLYNGLTPVNFSVVKKYIDRTTVEQVKNKITDLLSK